MSDSPNFEDYVSTVCNAMLLVRRDAPPEKVGLIHMADVTIRNTRSTSGTVLKAGPSVRPDIVEGSRIIFGEWAGSVAALEGITADSQTIFLSDADVYAVLVDEAPRGDDLGLPEAWMKNAMARAGHLLVERVEQPLMKGLVVAAPGCLEHTRATEAIVRSIGLGVDGYEVGDRVQLAGTGGRAIKFGLRSEKELWEVPPSYIFCKYHEAPPGKGVALQEQGFLLPTNLLEQAADRKYSEGDRRGLR